MNLFAKRNQQLAPWIRPTRDCSFNGALVRVALTRSERGMSTIDTMIVLVLFLILTVIVWNSLGTHELRGFHSDIEAIEDLYRQAKMERVDDQKHKCEVTEKPFLVVEAPDELTICCPDPDNHLGIGQNQSCLGPHGWIFDHAVIDPLEDVMTESMEGPPFRIWTITTSRDTTEIRASVNRATLLRRFVPIGILVVVCISSFVLMIASIERDSRNANEDKPSEPAEGILYSLVGLIISLAFLASIALSISLLRNIVTSANKRDVVTIHSDGVEIERSRLFGDQTFTFSPNDLRAVGIHRRKDHSVVYFSWIDSFLDHQVWFATIDDNEEATRLIEILQYHQQLWRELGD